MISPRKKKMIPVCFAAKSAVNIIMRPRIMKNNAGRWEIWGFLSPELIDVPAFLRQQAD